VNDDGSGEDLPIIDVRSPAERWGDAGRDGFDRLQERFRSSHLDIAAVAWILFVLGLTAIEIYTGFRQTLGSGPESGWYKAAIIASTGGMLLTFGAIIAVALAFAYDTTAARLALGLAALAGLWSVVASLVGVAVAFHEEAGLGVGFIPLDEGTESKVVSALGFVMQGGLGLVVFAVALHLLTVPRPRFDDFDDDFDDDDLDDAELS
jgi:hypothetical protein